MAVVVGNLDLCEFSNDLGMEVLGSNLKQCLTGVVQLGGPRVVYFETCSLGTCRSTLVTVGTKILH